MTPCSDSVWLQAHFYITGTINFAHLILHMVYLYGQLAKWGTNAILCSSLFIVQNFETFTLKQGTEH